MAILGFGAAAHQHHLSDREYLSARAVVKMSIQAIVPDNHRRMYEILKQYRHTRHLPTVVVPVDYTEGCSSATSEWVAMYLDKVQPLFSTAIQCLHDKGRFGSNARGALSQQVTWPGQQQLS